MPGVRLPPQSPSRYIRRSARRQRRTRPVAPAVSKSLHSSSRGGRQCRGSGCPRSLQVATFGGESQAHLCVVRLPPQSPSRYIHRCGASAVPRRPVAPAVSKSLHSCSTGTRGSTRSGCPRSLQVATFAAPGYPPPGQVRLPPQSPSRYIRPRAGLQPRGRPVAPAVSKSLHSRPRWARGACRSGCPRSLQVATFHPRAGHHDLQVRLPPQSPSRYIPSPSDRRASRCPVAPAVSKSLHSRYSPARHTLSSGCPRSLQVATFLVGGGVVTQAVRLPPQSPSRYIQAERNSLFGLNFFAFDRGSMHWYKAVRLERAYDGFQSPVAGPASGRVSPESHEAIVTISAWS